MRAPLLMMLSASLVALAGCTEADADETPTRTDVVVIPGPWVFEPAVAEVTAGTTVTFENHGGADHTVTFEGLDFDEVVPPGGETTYTFDTPGRYEYVCKYHPPDMRGTIVVTEPAPTAHAWE